MIAPIEQLQSTFAKAKIAYRASNHRTGYRSAEITRFSRRMPFQYPHGSSGDQQLQDELRYNLIAERAEDIDRAAAEQAREAARAALDSLSSGAEDQVRRPGLESQLAHAEIRIEVAGRA